MQKQNAIIYVEAIVLQVQCPLRVWDYEIETFVNFLKMINKVTKNMNYHRRHVCDFGFVLILMFF